MGAVSTILSALRQIMPEFAGSDASIEAKIIDAVGTFADTEIMERINTLNVINNALATQKITTVEYYRRKAIAYQQGDALIYDPINQGGTYAVINPEKQIIKQAYIVGNYPNYTLLVNALGADGHLRTLTQGEVDAFRTYFRAFQPLGLELTINSMAVAKITDPNIVIYVQPGTDAAEAAAQINANLLAHEAILRNSNAVSLTEIEDVIQSYPNVSAVGFDDPVATEVNLGGVQTTVYPEKGIFQLTNGAFTFATEITTANITTLQ